MHARSNSCSEALEASGSSSLRPARSAALQVGDRRKNILHAIGVIGLVEHGERSVARSQVNFSALYRSKCDRDGERQDSSIQSPSQQACAVLRGNLAPMRFSLGMSATNVAPIVLIAVSRAKYGWDAIAPFTAFAQQQNSARCLEHIRSASDIENRK